MTVRPCVQFVISRAGSRCDFAWMVSSARFDFSVPNPATGPSLPWSTLALGEGLGSVAWGEYWLKEHAVSQYLDEWLSPLEDLGEYEPYRRIKAQEIEKIVQKVSAQKSEGRDGWRRGAPTHNYDLIELSKKIIEA